jgi:hypothetical protein
MQHARVNPEPCDCTCTARTVGTRLTPCDHHSPLLLLLLRLVMLLVVARLEVAPGVVLGTANAAKWVLLSPFFFSPASRSPTPSWVAGDRGGGHHSRRHKGEPTLRHLRCQALRPGHCQPCYNKKPRFMRALPMQRRRPVAAVNCSIQRRLHNRGVDSQEGSHCRAAGVLRRAQLQ